MGAFLAGDRSAISGKLRILLQDVKSGMFLDSTGQWTANMEEAAVFSSGSNAVMAAVEHGRMDCHMLYTFADPSMNFLVPIRPEKP